MPFLLLCGMGFSAFFTGIGVLVMGLMIPIFLFGSGPFRSNGIEVDKATFLVDAAPVVLGMLLVLGAYGAIAWGLWKERPWTRTAIMAFWGTMGAATVLVAILAPVDNTAATEEMNPVGSMVMFGFMWGIAAWYCYGKENVVAYFKAVEDQDAERNRILAGALREPVAPPPPAS